MASLIDGVSNSNLFGGISSAVSGIGSLFGGFATSDADKAQAQGYDTAAKYAIENAKLAAEAGGINELAAARTIQRTTGSEAAIAGGNGLKLAGSAASIVRDATQQGALQEGTIGMQTAINTTNYIAQSSAYQGAAQAARKAASAAETGGIFGAVGGILGVAKMFF